MNRDVSRLYTLQQQGAVVTYSPRPKRCAPCVVRSRVLAEGRLCRGRSSRPLTMLARAKAKAEVSVPHGHHSKCMDVHCWS
jgi:hypothetical protein